MKMKKIVSKLINKSGNGLLPVLFTLMLMLAGINQGAFAQSIAAGGYQSLYLACSTLSIPNSWGDNGSGQLGNNTTTDSHTPIQVSGYPELMQ